MKWILDSSKDFTSLIDSKLKANNMKLIHLTYSGLFKVGPFRKFEISIGKPQINDGAIQYKKTYYRIVELETRKKTTEKVWVKIKTNWLKETELEFKPSLNTIK